MADEDLRFFEDDDAVPIGTLIHRICLDYDAEDSARFMQTLKARKSGTVKVVFFSHEGEGSVFRAIFNANEIEKITGLEFKTAHLDDPWPERWRHADADPLADIQRMIHAGEFKGHAPIERLDPTPYQAPERPWSTPNRKRFKRANRRRK